MTEKVIDIAFKNYNANTDETEKQRIVR